MGALTAAAAAARRRLRDNTVFVVVVVVVVVFFFLFAGSATPVRSALTRVVGTKHLDLLQSRIRSGPGTLEHYGLKWVNSPDDGK